jgi:hypothetical protein
MINSSEDKKNFKNKNKNKKKQKGILTLDFIFSLTAVYSISMVFILLAITLMMSTVVQYMSFSMARSHISGDITVGDQQDAVQEKLDQLLGTYLGKFIKTNDEGWFKIAAESEAKPFDNIQDSWSGDAGSSRQRSYGIKIVYTSNILKNIKLPLIGSPSDGATGDGFAQGNIFSFLYRQPSTEECLNFNRARWKALQQRFQGLTGMPNFADDDSGAQADNGC